MASQYKIKTYVTMPQTLTPPAQAGAPTGIPAEGARHSQPATAGDPHGDGTSPTPWRIGRTRGRLAGMKTRIMAILAAKFSAPLSLERRGVSVSLLQGAALCAFAIVFMAAAGAQAAEPDPVKTAGEIRAEAVRPNDDPAGRPLPLAGHWNTGHYPRAKGMDAAFQVSLVERGCHVLPAFHLSPAGGEAGWPMTELGDYYGTALRRAAELKLPISFVTTQFEAGLTTDKKYFDLPAEKNPNVVAPDGKLLKKVSPFGPVEPWGQIGRQWTDRPLLVKLQELYPDPPLVLWVSNNEHARLTWSEAEKQSKRYLDKHGPGKDDQFKRQVTAEGWMVRYRALQAGMRDGLTAPAWKKNSLFIGYDAFGPPHFGRWGGWMEYSLIADKFIDPAALTWDGGSPSYYVHNWNPSTDHTVWGPQVESMNWPFMLDEAFKLNPKFWWEISVWDGHEPTREDDMRKVYARKGQTFTPDRYGGFVQFGLWLLRPRVVREFRGWTDDRKEMMPYFQAMLDAVDRVYADEALQAFWRKGRLVPVSEHKHPYQQNVPERYKNVDRWFLLETDLTPPRPWKLETEIPVFAVALELGEKPARRWLIVAHSPVQDRKGVRITLPGYGPVTADVAVKGTFVFVEEKPQQW